MLPMMDAVLCPMLIYSSPKQVRRDLLNFEADFRQGFDRSGRRVVELLRMCNNIEVTTRIMPPGSNIKTAKFNNILKNISTLKHNKFITCSTITIYFYRYK